MLADGRILCRVAVHSELMNGKWMSSHVARMGNLRRLLRADKDASSLTWTHVRYLSTYCQKRVHGGAEPGHRGAQLRKLGNSWLAISMSLDMLHRD